MHEPAERFHQTLPIDVAIKHAKDDPISYDSRDQVWRWPLCAPNPPWCRQWLLFDIDHGLDGQPPEWNFSKVGLEPNLIVVNPANNHAHYLYRLADPVVRLDERSNKVVRFEKMVRNAMTVALNADPAYPGVFVKTPFCSNWRTVERRVEPYRLNELAEPVQEHLTLFLKRKLPGIDSDDYDGLFNAIRHAAYRLKPLCDQNYDAFTQMITAKANEWNRSASKPVSANEIAGTVRRVCEFVRDVYRPGAGKRPSVLLLDPSLPLEQRQSIAAEYTHRLQRQRSSSLVADARADLAQRGLVASQSAVAELTGLSLSTVKRNWAGPVAIREAA